MDRAQIQNDFNEAMQIMLDTRQANTWTAMPGIVTAVNLTAMTCEVQVAIKAPITDENGNVESVSIYPLLDVPIVFPASGGFALTFPLAVGDEVLIVIASRCIDAWWQSGGIQEPMEARMNDLSDGFAIPGPKSQPHVLPSINSTKAMLRNNAGTVYLSMGSKFAMKNAVTDLKTVLSALTLSLETFATGLDAITLAAHAATLLTALGVVDTAIAALLEASA